MERLGRVTWPEKPRGSGEGDGNRPNTIVKALKRYIGGGRKRGIGVKSKHLTRFSLGRYRAFDTTVSGPSEIVTLMRSVLILLQNLNTVPSPCAPPSAVVL